MLQGPQRRARPMDMGPSGTAETTLGAPLTESTWILPIADAATLPEDGAPAGGGRPAGVCRAARDAAPGLRGSTAASPATPARGVDPARGAALAGERGRRAARDDRRLGEQRAAAGARDDRRARRRRERSGGAAG